MGGEGMTADEIKTLIEDTVPPATEEQIRAVEAEIAHTLPDEYRAFLARCDGGGVIRAHHRSSTITGLESTVL
jgi:cell wall assembly regulator SMI1